MEDIGEGDRDIAAEPLSGLRVVDVSGGIGGGYCAKMLGDAGAEVVLVEPAEGAPLRRWTCSGPPTDGRDGALFRYLHHGHRSVAAERTDLDALLTGADVLVTDRLDAASVAARHPHLVVVAITPWGLEGPFVDRPATELIMQAESGGIAIRGRDNLPPFQAGGQITEWCTGAYAAVAALGALRNGHGELIDVSWHAVANLTCTTYSDLFDSLRGHPPATSLPGSLETPSIEPTLDGYVGFNTNTRQQFQDFCVLIERPDLLAEPEWGDLYVRTQRWDEWNEIVHAWTTKHTTDEIVEQAALLRIPSAPVADAARVAALDHVAARGVLIDDPAGTFRFPRRPWTIDGVAAPGPRPAPAVGEHSASLPAHERRTRPAHDGLPLAGLRVVDLTAWWAGPSGAAILAALGADVIHVESVKRPDGMRMSGGMFAPAEGWWELSAFFMAANLNKRGLTLDLASDAGRELAVQLITTADVVVENYTPRVLESFGLTWDVVHAANPQAILVRMPAFGLTGPWRDRPGFAQTMEQVTGLAWLTGHVEDQPRIQRGPCDPNGGLHACFAALAALFARDRSGHGHFVEAPMFEAALAVAAELTIEYAAYGTELSREGNRSPHAAPQNLYPTGTPHHWLALSVADDTQWQALCALLGRDDWAADPTLATIPGRRARHDELDAAITAWSAPQARQTAIEALVAAGIPCGEVVDPRRASSHPQLVARSYAELVEHPVAGTHLTPTLPFRFASVDRWVRSPAPTIGQHNDEILDELGVPAERRAELTAENVIGTRIVGL